MIRACGIVLLLVLAGCAGGPSSGYSSTATCSNPSEYQCQVEMYMKSGA